MKRFTNAVERALQAGNWYAALSLSLILPDLCGGAEKSGRNNSQARYVDWVDQWLSPKYRVTYHDHDEFKARRLALGVDACPKLVMNLIEEFQSKPPKIVTETWLAGADCWALRNSLLHQGGGTTKLVFTDPPAAGMVHGNRSRETGTLQLQVDIFCRDMCTAVEEWDLAAGSEPKIMAAKAELLRIHSNRSTTSH